jgi:hypothetical protein
MGIVKNIMKKPTFKVNRKLNTQSNKDFQFKNKLINGCSIETIAKNHLNTTAVLNGLIEGGSTFNNRYDENNVFKNVADLDFESCYGSCLSQFNLPIGLPEIFHYTNDEKKKTLKEFLNIYESELEENLYTITVSGVLSFEQTLIYSKLITYYELSENISKQTDDDDLNDVKKSTFDSDFTILLKEIKNGIITSDILNVLRKICTNQELNEIYNLTVITGVFYKKSNKIENKKDFIDYLAKEENQGKHKGVLNGYFDERSRKWTLIELKNLINPLLVY